MKGIDCNKAVWLWSGALVLLVSLWPGALPNLWAVPSAVGIDYDIVYVRYARNGDTGNMDIPMGELPDLIEAGADLVLLHPDGSEEILVGCKDPQGYPSATAEQGDTDIHGLAAPGWPACSVQDPMVSYDGEWVYYAKYVDVNTHYRTLLTGSYIFKMQIGGANPARVEVQLTDASTGFGNDRWAGRGGPQDQPALGIRDLGPTPLPNGDLVFTSNRMGLVPPRQGTAKNKGRPSDLLVAQLHRMSDHDGSTPNLNLHSIGVSSLHLVQHPSVLEDGRLLFSNWDDVGTKYKYAMMTLYTSHPDGSNLSMFMEPHERRGRLDHFSTQLGSGEVVTVSYYPGNVWGFGTLLRMPVDIAGPDFERAGKNSEEHRRAFARKGTINLTAHTDGADLIAPNRSGRYSTPSPAPNGGLLVSYSPGAVLGGGPVGLQTPVVNGGLYLILDASKKVTDPSQLLALAAPNEFNAMWPRAVVPYARIHGRSKPVVIADVANDGHGDARLPAGTPFGLFGSSSIYQRESAPHRGSSFAMDNTRSLSTGEWRVQGAQAGWINNDEIYGVRIIAAVPKPFQQPYQVTPEEQRLIDDPRAVLLVDGFTAMSNERWRILGEIPVKKRDAAGNLICNPAERMLLRDQEGDIDPNNPYDNSGAGPCGIFSPDTSFLTRLPADVPFFAQGIDKNGMTLFSELTWRHLVPGEVRTDCGGCHGHTLPHIPFAGTVASASSYTPWPLESRTPYVTEDANGQPTTAYRLDGAGNDMGSWGIEFNRDILPILNAKCVSCHTVSGNTTGTDLVLDDPVDGPYWRLAKDQRARYGGPPPAGADRYFNLQRSKYIRALQARQSYLMWKLYGRRLDGRTNADRADDLDYVGGPMPPAGSPQLTGEEKRLISRWIDLGAPIDLPGRTLNRYTMDDLLPVLTVTEPHAGINPQGLQRIRFGLFDGDSGIDMNRLTITLDTDLPGFSAGSNLRSLAVFSQNNTIATLSLPSGAQATPALTAGTPYTLSISAYDRAGNREDRTVTFQLSAAALQAPRNLSVIQIP